MRGDIETPWAGRAKEYAWSLMAKHAPRNITPSDIDYITECGGHFLVCEMKTGETEMKYGQRLMLERLLACLSSKSRVVIVRHPSVERVVIPEHVVSFETWRWFDGAVMKGGPYPGEDFAAWYERWHAQADALDLRVR